jgi:hypothetical protein
MKRRSGSAVSHETGNNQVCHVLYCVTERTDEDDEEVDESEDKRRTEMQKSIVLFMASERQMKSSCSR